MTDERSVLGLGIFSSTKALQKEQVEPLVGKLPEGARSGMTTYLQRGAIVFAAMEYTTDVLNQGFGVSGGSGILTDGNYCWRRDLADYVDAYGVELPHKLVELARSRHWVPPDLTEAEVLAIGRYLMSGKTPSTQETSGD
jgi:hypothetical protein